MQVERAEMGGACTAAGAEEEEEGGGEKEEEEDRQGGAGGVEGWWDEEGGGKLSVGRPVRMKTRSRRVHTFPIGSFLRSTGPGPAPTASSSTCTLASACTGSSPNLIRQRALDRRHLLLSPQS